MNCSWYETSYWASWPWAMLILWLLMFLIGAFIVFRYLKINHLDNQVNPQSIMNNRLETKKECPKCSTTVEEAYIRCPECHHKLKSNCSSCGKVVDTNWSICPYCESKTIK
jgi:DNA-directed RNA polymerase subunit RPC12/RpoP